MINELGYSSRYMQLQNFLNQTASSGCVNVRYIIEEMAKELELDLKKVMGTQSE